MEVMPEKFRESKSDFKGSTKRNFQFFKNFEGLNFEILCISSNTSQKIRE